MRKLLIFFTSVILIFCEKLSPDEDGERWETCGRFIHTKVLTGTPADDSAPWTMRVTSKKNETFSAILISDRHVLTAGSSVMRSKNGTKNKKWEWTALGKEVDLSKCNDNELKIPDEAVASMRVQLSVCQDEDKCGTSISRSIVQAYYFGNCEPGLPPFGLILMEIDLGVPQKEPYFVPACVFKTSISNDDEVEFHSAGDPITANKKQLIKSTPSKVIKCKTWSYDQSMCASHVACHGDFGGGLIKSVDGKSTVVGISYGPEEAKCAPAQSDHLVKVEHYLDKLCTHAGICETSPPEEKSAASSIGMAAVLMMNFLALVTFS